MFKHALVRPPAPNFVHGLTTAGLGKPDYERALEQHAQYVSALQSCGLEVIQLAPDPKHPDATFVEDTALLTSRVAIITHPGAESRQGEILALEPEVRKFFTRVEHIQAPGTLEAGDIMMAGDHFYIGLSDRTNTAGAQQMMVILQQNGYTASTINLAKVLHLKTGVAYLENQTMLVCGEFVDHPDFKGYRQITIPQEESYAANCIWVNDTVIIPAGYPVTQGKITQAGYKTLEVDVSEFKKLDGGLSCLSLRF